MEGSVVGECGKWEASTFRPQFFVPCCVGIAKGAVIRYWMES